MDARLTVAGAGVALVVFAALAWYLRDKLDLIAEHGRDAVRHMLAGVLMLGTLAATVWTFSAGHLTLGGEWEMLVSVGGVAAALELGVIFLGAYIGQLDQRIRSAKRADDKAQYTAYRRELMHWFYGVAAISLVSNVIYRAQALQNFWLACFISAAPTVLVILFCIKLRPLPTDHAEIGRQSMQRGLVIMANQAQRVMLRTLRRMGNGQALSDAERAQFATAVALVRVYASGEQQAALDHVISQGAAPAQLEAPGAHSGDGQYLTSATVAELYDISPRTAQLWISQTPGRRPVPHSKSWEAPAASLYAAHGVPSGPTLKLTAPVSSRRRKRTEPQSDAQETLAAAAPAQSGEPGAPASVPVLTYAVFEPSQGDGRAKGSGV